MVNQTHIAPGEKEKLVDQYGWTVGEEEGKYPFLWKVGGLLAGLILPYLVFFICVALAKSCRKRRLTNYVYEWNRWHFINYRTLLNQRILMQPWQWCETFLWWRGHYTKGMMLPDYLIYLILVLL